MIFFSKINEKKLMIFKIDRNTSALYFRASGRIKLSGADKCDLTCNSILPPLHIQIGLIKNVDNLF